MDTLSAKLTTYKPLISIIIPTFNRASIISETLDSVLVQTYINWECLVIDDGSEDNTEEVVKTYIKKDSRFQYYLRPSNFKPGGNGARNFGLHICKGDYINWLDSDDIFEECKLEKQITQLQNTQALVSVSYGEYFSDTPKDDYGNLWSEFKVGKDGVFDALISQKMRWQTGAVLWSKSILINSCWEEDLRGAQEWFFHIIMSLKLKDLDVVFIEEVLLYIRNSNQSITRSYNASRFSNYLKARVMLLNYLIENDEEKFEKYSNSVYRFSLRYVKLLIELNDLKSINSLSKFIYNVSFIKFIKFRFGLLMFIVLKKDYFLKRVFN